METLVMHARIVTIASAALLASGAMAAEPAKKPVPQAKQAQTRSKPVVLASADQTSTEASPGAVPGPVKHRAARVTTCRCGDPQVVQPQEPQ